MVRGLNNVYKEVEKKYPCYKIAFFVRFLLTHDLYNFFHRCMDSVYLFSKALINSKTRMGKAPRLSVDYLKYPSSFTVALCFVILLEAPDAVLLIFTRQVANCCRSNFFDPQINEHLTLIWTRKKSAFSFQHRGNYALTRHDVVNKILRYDSQD